MPLDETRTAGEAGHLADHNDLHAFRNDFSAVAPTDGQTLVWNATSGRWEPSGASALTVIAETILSATTATIDFTSIPSTYRDLRLVVVGRNSTTATRSIIMNLNGDTAIANYLLQTLEGSAGTASAAEVLGTSIYARQVGSTPGTTALASAFGESILDIPGYASTSHLKIVNFVDAMVTGTATGNLKKRAAMVVWQSTVAINQITLSLDSGSFGAGSRATLYGVKGA